MVKRKVPAKRLRLGRYTRAGIRLGVFIAATVATVMIFATAWATFLTRPNNPGGEILVPILVYLVGYTGWMIRGLWEERKKNNKGVLGK
jgi:hypothetical protein